MSSSRGAEVKRGREEEAQDGAGPSDAHAEAAPDKKKRRRGSIATGGGSQAKTHKRVYGGRATGRRANRTVSAWEEAERRRREEQERRRRVGVLFVNLPDVLHGLIGSWLGTWDLLELCACSRFFNKTYTGRVTNVSLGGGLLLELLGSSLLRRHFTLTVERGIESFGDGDDEGGEASEAAGRGEARVPIASHMPKLQLSVAQTLSRFTGLRKLVVRKELIVVAVAAVLRGSGREGGAAVLQQLEHLEVSCPATGMEELLLALSAKRRGGGGGAACVCPGLRHLVLLESLEGTIDGDEDDEEQEGATNVLEALVNAVTSRDQAGAASLLTLRLPVSVRLQYAPAPSATRGRLLSRLLLTSKACESLEALLLNGSLDGECNRAVGAYLSSDRAASLRRLRCAWAGWQQLPPDGRATIPSALASGRLPLLEDLELMAEVSTEDDVGHLMQWAASPSASRLVSLSLYERDLHTMLRAAVDSHGWPRLRTLKVDGGDDDEAAMVALVDGMEARGALPCLECLEVHGMKDQGIRRLAAFLAQGKGCSRTLQRLDLRYSTATDEAGAQLGRAMQAGGLTALEQLRLDGNEAWGDATVCAMVEALEMGKGETLKDFSMNNTGLGSVGFQRIVQAVRDGPRRRPKISFFGCDIPDLTGSAVHCRIIYPRQTLRSFLGGSYHFDSEYESESDAEVPW